MHLCEKVGRFLYVRSVLILVLMLGGCLKINEGALITHRIAPKEIDLEAIGKRLQAKKSLTLPLSETLSMLEQLNQFELGRFLLKNKGLDGFWTAYVILHGSKRSGLSGLEEWLLTNAPTVRATQERFRIFQQEMQSRLRSEMSIATVPCGLMDDVLGLDFSSVQNVSLVGIDLDANSLRLAKENALHQGGYDKVKLLRRDAWNIGESETYDVVMSNGLNIYEPNPERVVALYKQLNKTLKKGGVLIISFLTPPPGLSSESTWKNVNQLDALKQKAIFSDIVEAGFRVFRTEAEMRRHLGDAGFDVVKVVYDSQGIFPMVVAIKR